MAAGIPKGVLRPMNREEEDNTVPSSFNIARWSCKRGFCQHELCKGSSPPLPPPPDRLVHHLLVCLALDGRSSSFNALIYQGEEEGCKARRRESKSNRPPLSSFLLPQNPRRNQPSSPAKIQQRRRRRRRKKEEKQSTVHRTVCSAVQWYQPKPTPHPFSLLPSSLLFVPWGLSSPLHFLLRTNLPL